MLGPTTPKVPLGDPAQPLPTGGTSQGSLDALPTEGLCPPKTDMWMPDLKAIALEGGAVERRSGHEPSPREENSCPCQRGPESSLISSAAWGRSGSRAVHEPGSVLPPDTGSARAPTLDFQDCEGRTWKPRGVPRPELRVPSPALRLRLASSLAGLVLPTRPQERDLPPSITPPLICIEQ